MDETLSRAAQEGNVSDLYRLIQRDGNVLRRIDEIEFIDTPLHIAAAEGCIDFAMEIMNLKPSFARKLNKNGLSPIHLAVEKGHKELVLNLIQNAKDLVHVKGKKGETPLHCVITREENPDQLLPKFLEICPECIRDVTTENQTALHIAVINNKIVALKLICKILRKTDYCEDVVNQKDRNGDTALHIAARHNQHEMLKQLLNCKADKYASNQAGSMPLDIAQQHSNKESISILRGCFIPRVSTFKYKLQKQIVKYVTRASSVFFHDMDYISSEDRNTLLVISGLLLTATYQASLSPPACVLQANNSSSNSSFINGGHWDDKKVKRKLVISEITFLLYYIPTYAVFIVTIFLTLGLLKPFPCGFRSALQVLLAYLAICFDESISFLAPTNLAYLVIKTFSVLVFVLMTFMCIAYRVSKLSVIVLGCWLFHTCPFKHFIGKLLLGCWFFLFLHDEFWKGSFLVVAYGLVLVVVSQALKDPILVLGCWFFLSFCRFCIKRCNEHCNA